MKPANILMACGACLVLTVALTSCSTDTQVVTPEQKVEVAGKTPVRLALADRARRPGFPRKYVKTPGQPKSWDCVDQEKGGCSDEIVVEADRPKLVGQIANLDNAIADGTTSQFFSSPIDYSEVFGTIPSQIVDDLRDGRTVVRRLEEVPSSIRVYSLVDRLGVAVDYSGVN